MMNDEQNTLAQALLNALQRVTVERTQTLIELEQARLRIAELEAQLTTMKDDTLSTLPSVGQAGHLRGAMNAEAEGSSFTAPRSSSPQLREVTKER